MHSPIPWPTPQCLLPPLLASLPAAAVSSQPPPAILPLLSPVLRQRVKFLSESAEDPWLPLLCYDQGKVGNLLQIAEGDRFEPHPVSGDVEVDWDDEVETRYKRVDRETLLAVVNLRLLGLRVKLVWCVGDQEGGGDGWRISEITVLDSSPSIGESQEGWWESIEEAEVRFTEAVTQNTFRGFTSSGENGSGNDIRSEQSDDDGSYWAQYDNTPVRSPADKRSPVPDSLQGAGDRGGDDAYYAQYADVQPAVDNHDPDEAAQNGKVETTLRKDEILLSLRRDLKTHPELSESSRAWIVKCPDVPSSPPRKKSDSHLIQPLPASNNSSSGSGGTVAKLESTAAAQGQCEIGVKQHISTTMKSLFRLARAAGIEWHEFERLVKTELDVLVLMEEDDYGIERY